MIYTNKFLYKFQKFMYGRYGSDKFSNFLLALCAIIIVINAFLHSLVFVCIEFAILTYSIFRSLSRNIYKRQKENLLYMKIEKKVVNFFKISYDRIKYFKTKRYRKCPYCKNYLRLPIKKGNHTVSCPSCHKDFNVKIRF